MAAAVGPSGTSLYQGVEKSSFGFKLLENLGWKEGDGLGAKKQGIKEHVKVKKKYDALGVGAAEQVHRNRDWTTGMMSYDMILSGLKEISNKRAADPTNDHSSSGSDDDSASEGASASASEASDDEQPAPPKAKRHKPTQAAAKRSSSSGSDTSSSGSDSEAEATSSSSSDSDSSSSDSDADVPATAAARTAKLATHVGRYRRREAAKHVRGYSATDLAAILGASAEEVTQPAAVAHAAASDSSSSDSSDGGDSSDSEGSSEERMRPATPSLEAPLSGSSGRAEQPQAGAAASSGDKHVAQLPERKWWGSVFVSAGRMGSKGSALRPASDAKPKVTVNGFSEQDQTNLYMQAHVGKTQNRQGLGRSEMPKKVGGVRWAGTKTKIGDSSDEEEDAEDDQARQQRQEEEEAAAERRVAAEEAAAGIVIIMPKQRKAAAAVAPATAGVAPDAAVGAEAEPVNGKKRKAASHDTEQQTAKKSKKQSKVQQAQEKQQLAQQTEPPAAGKKEKRSKSKAAANTVAQQPVATAAAAIAIPVPVPVPALAPVVVPAAAAQAAGPSTAGKDIKWRKVALRILAAAPKRRMRARKLLKLAVEAAGLGKEGEGQLQHMLGTLRRSASKFDVSEKFVSLVAEC